MVFDSRRGGIGIVVVLISIGAGVGLGFVLDSPDSRSPRPEAGQSPRVGPGPYAEENGVPVGYARTEEGAVAAATNFGLLSTRDEFWSLEGLQNATAELSAPSWKGQASEEALTGFRFISRRYGTDADVSGAAIRYRVEEFSRDRASVKLWLVTVISGSTRATVDEAWGTATVNLIWTDGDWRVNGTKNETGPAPVDLPFPDGSSEDPKQLFTQLHEYSGAPLP